jgi:hypothetical protein
MGLNITFQWAVLVPSVWQVSGLNLVPEIGSLDLRFTYSNFHQAVVRIVPEVGSSLLSSTTFPIYSSLAILVFGAVQSMLLTALLMNHK